MRFPINLLTLTAILLLCAQCKGKNADTIPDAPEYSDTTQWYVSQRNAPADVFYIISTETGDYPRDGIMCHYADTYADSVRAPMHAEMLGVDTLLSGTLNFYSPYYRQCSLQSFTSDSLRQARLPVALDDVRRAFKYYLTHLNPNRPFVIAGFSQGTIIMLQLLKEMDDSTYNRMIAAYAIGIAVTDSDLATTPHIRPARAADDTGVTICYNSVRDPSCFSGARPAFAINPINWKTDNTPATIFTEPSPLLPVDQQHKDTLTVRLDTATNLLLVNGYTATDYVLPLIGKEGNYHSREIWLYRDQLRQNIALRTARHLQNMH